MSFNEQNKWTAEWIRCGWNPAVPYLRKSFSVDKMVATAVVRVTALGVCELRLNGGKVGDAQLLPGWTDYRKRVYFHSYDVTDRMNAGENVIGGIIAPGWFAGYFGPFGDKGYYGHDAWFSAELDIHYADGTAETICTDADWKGVEGPILSADLLMGETYDARRKIPGWDLPGFDDSAWGAVNTLDPHEQLPAFIEPFPGEAVKTVAECPTVAVTHPEPDRHVFDLGQNMVGVVRLKLNVSAGTEIVIKHGEMLNPDGTLYTENLRSAKAIDRYIAKGEGEEVWQPRFTFHGFRYVEVYGLPGEPSFDTVTGVVWMSGLQETAMFECSDEKVNQLFSNIQWGFRGNYLDVPTDCPQRDERLGWTGDTQIFIRSATYLADLRPFYNKWLVDLHDAQHENGGYPDMAPFMGRMGHGQAAWADAGIICPYVLWQAYGDLGFIRPWWNSMKKYMELISSDGNLHNGPDAVSYGDWLNIGEETPVPLIGLAYRAYDAHLMAEMASAMGESADELRFQSLEQSSRRLFKETFIEDEKIVVKTQTACALAIAMDLLEGNDYQKACDCLVKLLEKNKGYLSTGFVGTAYLCPALTKMGRSDLAVELVLNEGHPSWLYEVNNGATTIWERWNSWTKDNGFGDVGMNSFNHYAFGVVCEWMFESLAGIKPGSPGFRTLEVEPCLTNRFDFVKASYDSVAGPVSIHWKKKGAGYVVELETPVPATIRLPYLTETVNAGRHVFRVLPDDEETCQLSSTEAAGLTA
ncbi:family 78 glycoside hydrolase catalytic domain [Pontiellaceae bacterium B12227]|nr:family 78 glycoside hydrolase catalytic domain [Pontiellaceae bacterium B12227]